MVQLQYLIISFVSEYSAALVQQLAEACSQAQCDLIQVRFSQLGQHQAGFVKVSGNWIAIAKLENQLKALNQKNDNVIHYRRTESSTYPEAMIAYLVQIIGQNKPDILSKVLDFFVSQEVWINEIASHQYHTAHTRTPMLTIQSTILIPATHHLAHVREAFILFCEEHNLDAIFEPERS